MGHFTATANDARTALSILASQPIDLLLTDAALPDMTGATLAECATSRLPSLAVIFASGRSAEPTVPANVAARTLMKPFSFDALVGAIASLGKVGS
jgi:DNA-binding NtrC family response regulator